MYVLVGRWIFLMRRWGGLNNAGNSGPCSRAITAYSDRVWERTFKTKWLRCLFISQSNNHKRSGLWHPRGMELSIPFEWLLGNVWSQGSGFKFMRVTLFKFHWVYSPHLILGKKIPCRWRQGWRSARAHDSFQKPTAGRISTPWLCC